MSGRNDPCPCGSGQKHKKCCGKVVSITPLNTAPRPAIKRSCGNCTACCDGWLVGTIHGREMKPGVPCHFVRDGGCTIYEERPQSPCRNFVCSWITHPNLFPEMFRPDQLGVIIAQIPWRNRPAFLLRSAGNDPDSSLIEWMMKISVATGSPFFYEQAGEKYGFGPPEFQQEMILRAQRGEPMW